MLFYQHVPSDGLLATGSDFGKLGGQALNEVFDPAGHVHVAFAYALDCPVECGPVPVVIFTEREQPLEIVSGPVKTKG